MCVVYLLFPDLRQEKRLAAQEGAKEGLGGVGEGEGGGGAGRGEAGWGMMPLSSPGYKKINIRTRAREGCEVLAVSVCLLSLRRAGMPSTLLCSALCWEEK